MSRVDDALSAARTRLAEAERTSRGVDGARRVVAALEHAAEVLMPPLSRVSAMPHRHARAASTALPAQASLLSGAERAELAARRRSP